TSGTLAISSDSCTHIGSKLLPDPARSTGGPRMKRLFLFCAALGVMVLLGRCNLPAQTGGELRFCLRAEPKTFNPALVDDEPSETIRYLTGGGLVPLYPLTPKPPTAPATEA